MDNNPTNESTKYCIFLEEKSDLRKTHFRFNPDTELIFSLGPSLYYHTLDLHTNYPLENEPFQRNIFRSIKFNYKHSHGPFLIDAPAHNSECTFKASIPGSYAFFVVDKSSNYSIIEIMDMFKFNLEYNTIILYYRMNKSLLSVGYFVIDPNVRETTKSKIIIDQISIQTVISKCLGSIPDWWNRLKVSYKCGFNSLHFTPFQKYGKSRSSYSIYDHFSFDSSICSGKINDNLLPIINKLRTKFNCLIIDIVLNHVSNDSPIIMNHPESFYNLQNSPHLRLAFLIDRALFYLTLGLIKANGNNLKISSISELKKIESVIKNDILTRVRLVEFYVVDIEKTIKNFIEYILSKKYKNIKHSNDEIFIIQDKKYRRLRSKIDFDSVFNKYLQGNSEINSTILNTASSNLRNHLIYLNQIKSNYVQGILNDVVTNVHGHVYYHFLDPTGPKQNFISLENPLTIKYFSICLPDYIDTSIENDELLINSKDCKFIVAHQGWVMNTSTHDFVSPSSEVFIRRQLIAWGDCIKIRWGNSPSDSSFIWEYMQNYVDSMAQYFDGFRIDNCHSTPIHVLEVYYIY
ncbi:hypothetical protein HZS_841 [Henneguya salminicola]|nr:hypothetical protein HZS_841 [Henneguya salminicola]